MELYTLKKHLEFGTDEQGIQNIEVVDPEMIRRI
jgi:hypothetical protein